MALLRVSLTGWQAAQPGSPAAQPSRPRLTCPLATARFRVALVSLARAQWARPRPAPAARPQLAHPALRLRRRTPGRSDGPLRERLGQPQRRPNASLQRANLHHGSLPSASLRSACRPSASLRSASHRNHNRSSASHHSARRLSVRDPSASGPSVSRHRAGRHGASQRGARRRGVQFASPRASNPGPPARSGAGRLPAPTPAPIGRPRSGCDRCAGSSCRWIAARSGGESRSR